MLNPLVLSNINYQESISENTLSFVEVDLIPFQNNSGTFLFQNKDINNTYIETKKESDEYNFDLSHKLDFENCTINNLVLSIKNYTSSIHLLNCKIETLTIELNSDGYLGTLHLTDVQAKLIIIKEIDLHGGKSRRLSIYKRDLILDTTNSFPCNIINNLIIEGSSEELKNSIEIKSRYQTNSVIENLTVNNYIIDHRNLRESLDIEETNIGELAIQKLKLNNVSIFNHRNIVYQNICIEVPQLTWWKKFKDVRSKIKYLRVITDTYPRLDYLALLVLSNLLSVIKCNGLVLENKISDLNIPGLFADKTESTGVIQILPQSSEYGKVVYDTVMRDLSFVVSNRTDILRVLSQVLDFIKYKSTVTLEDLTTINAKSNDLIRSRFELDRSINHFTLSLTDDGMIKTDVSDELKNERLIRRDESEFMPSSFFAREYETISSSTEASNRATTVSRPSRGRNRSAPSPTFRIPESLRAILDTPTVVSPTNFDPAFLQNRTTAVNNTPEETENPILTFRDAAEDTNNASQELRSSISEAVNLTLLDSTSRGGFRWSENDLVEVASMFMPRDPLSSIRMNLEAQPRVQYDIDIFSDSEEE